MAEQLIGNLTAPFDPSKYVDEYRANLMKIIHAKLKGKKIAVVEPEDRESTPVVDLIARLQESLEQGAKKSKRAARGRRASGAEPRPRRHARRKSA
jgi:DNA end-binding protein Ku